MNEAEVVSFVDKIIYSFRFDEGFSLPELFEVAAVYIGITGANLNDEKLMFVTGRGSSIPVIKWASGRNIKRSEAVDILEFKSNVIHVDPWQSNAARIECELHKRYDHLQLGKQKLWKIPGMGGIKKRQIKKEGVLYKVFVDYSFVLPKLVDGGEIGVQPNRRMSG